jgi:hypothetical protein
MVIEDEITQPDFGSTALFQASMNDFDSVSLHTLPMELKVYPAATPNKAQMMLAGIRALGSLAKMATPLGNDRTPAPMTLLAKLNTDVGILASPPDSALETNGASAVADGTLDSLKGDVT